MHRLLPDIPPLSLPAAHPHTPPPPGALQDALTEHFTDKMRELHESGAGNNVSNKNIENERDMIADFSSHILSCMRRVLGIK